MADPAII